MKCTSSTGEAAFTSTDSVLTAKQQYNYQNKNQISVIPDSLSEITTVTDSVNSYIWLGGCIYTVVEKVRKISSFNHIFKGINTVFLGLGRSENKNMKICIFKILLFTSIRLTPNCKAINRLILAGYRLTEKWLDRQKSY